MKTSLTSVLVGSLLTTLAVAQQPSRFAGRRGFVYNPERRTAQTFAPGAASLMVYAMTIGFQFGAVDLRSGAFLPIGPGLPPDVGDGLVQGPGTSLLGLGFSGNLYALDPKTAATKLIGPTGIPALTFVPFSENPDGSVNVFGASLFGARGKFYAFFVTVAINFAAGTFHPLIPGALYEIDPATGHATMIAPTDSGLSAIVNVKDTIYAFTAWTGQV